jgi:hypothetical protein
MLWLESDFFSFFWLHIIRIVEVELIFFQFLELTFSSRVFFVAKFLPLASKKRGGLQTVQRIYLEEKGPKFTIF